MPTVLRLNGYRFHFYAYDCREPRHMHVEKAGKSAKFWLDPIEFEFNKGFNARELREIEDIIVAHAEIMRREWDDFCATL